MGLFLQVSLQLSVGGDGSGGALNKEGISSSLALIYSANAVCGFHLSAYTALAVAH